MSHTRYESECFVLEAEERGEANAQYLLFTKDLGLLRASAQGVRLSQGKLRYSLQEFSKADVSLVRGKEFWRVVGAQSKVHLWMKQELSSSKLLLLAKIFKLVKRLVTGEEKNQTLYSILEEAVTYLQGREFNDEELLLLELLVVAHVLKQLGYFEVTEVYKPFLEVQLFADTMLHEVEGVKKGLLQDINKALKETQL